jgi:uncharacterized membrane protein SpoIIM required for sporulation
MLEAFTAVFHTVNMQILFLSVLLFFIGYALAPTAYYKKISWLTAYPFWIIKLMDGFFSKKHHALKIFIIIFSLNTFSLFVNLLSAWGVILPFLFMIYLGINIGVVIYHSMQGRYYYLGLLNPVALLELPAAWLSIAMAIQFSLTHFLNVTDLPLLSFSTYVDYFLQTVIPLLLLAGIIETILIVKTGPAPPPQD